MDSQSARDLLFDLLEAQDDHGANDSDDQVVSLTPEFEPETVIERIRKELKTKESESESDLSEEDTFDDPQTDPDYLPASSFLSESADTSLALDSMGESEVHVLVHENGRTKENVAGMNEMDENEREGGAETRSADVDETGKEAAVEIVREEVETNTRTEIVDIEREEAGGNETVRLEGDIKVKGRKRKRNPSNWAKNLKKKAVAKGEAYVTKSGKNIPARTTGKDCQCRKHCFNKIPEEQRDNLLQAFNNIGDRHQQDLYLHGCIERNAPARSRPRTGERVNANGGKRFIYAYNARLDGVKVEVCAVAFMALHGIGRTRLKRLRTASTSVPSLDKRGSHLNHVTLPKDVITQIKEHINSFPKRESHYSRKDNAQKAFLNERLNVKRMWLLYLERHEPEQRLLYRTNRAAMKPVVKYHYYLFVFKHDYNLRFGLPRSDTCPACDKFAIDIAAAGDGLKKTLEEQRDLHQRHAEKAYDMLKHFTEQVKRDQTLEMYTVDFQQNLPAPSISAGDIFYSRQLWTYNFGLHDCKDDDGVMHIWCESEAGRGSSEVASCLRRTIMERHKKHNGERLVIFTDGCGGQNKNKAIISFFLTLVQEGVYKAVDHYFLYRGHTFLPNDRDFAQIEKRKHVEIINRPDDWRRVIEDSRLSHPFQVVTLHHQDFLDYKRFADDNIKSTVNCTDGHRLRFKEVMWFSYGSTRQMNETFDQEVMVEHPNEVWCGYTHNIMEPWKRANFLKRNKTLDVANLVRKYTTPVGIKAAKKKDLMTLVKKGLILANHHGFYQNLPTRVTELLDEDDGDDFV